MKSKITLFNFFSQVYVAGKSFDDGGGDKFIFPDCSNFATPTVRNNCLSLKKIIFFLLLNIYKFSNIQYTFLVQLILSFVFSLNFYKFFDNSNCQFFLKYFCLIIQTFSRIVCTICIFFKLICSLNFLFFDSTFPDCSKIPASCLYHLLFLRNLIVFDPTFTTTLISISHFVNILGLQIRKLAS